MVAITIFLILEITLLNGTMNTQLGDTIYETAKEEVAHGGFGVFVGFNAVFLVGALTFGGFIMFVVTQINMFGIKIITSIGLLLAIKYDLYKIFF